MTYRVAGLLTEVKKLVSVRSKLRGSVLDSLHEGGIEIVSPEFRNVRNLAAGKRFIPHRVMESAAPKSVSSPDELAFDKAEEAESLEALRLSLASLGDEIKQQEERLKGLDQGAEHERAQHQLAALQSRRERLERIIAAREAKISKPD